MDEPGRAEAGDAVVFVTVALMAVFLFGVDFLWQFLLKLIGVLRNFDTSGLGSDG